MPVDITLFRKEKGGDPDLVRKSEEKRCRDGKLVDEVIELDEQWRKYRHELNLLNKELGAVSKEINKKKKESKGQDEWEEEKKKASEINEKIAEKNLEEKKTHETLQKKVAEIGNIVHESVLADNNEDNNIVVRTWGEVNDIKVDGSLGHMNHHHLMRWLGMYDPERGSKITGHRGYFLKDFGVLLNQALINYGISFLMSKGYTIVQPPYFIRRDYMEKTWEIGDFEANLYQIENNEAYLIATSEQPISAMHADEWLKVKDLPIKYGGYSSCFRKEAGSAGKDLWGIFRVHQFDKIEQFVICDPEKILGIAWRNDWACWRVLEIFRNCLQSCKHCWRSIK